jgi:hypothetical protein
MAPLRCGTTPVAGLRRTCREVDAVAARAWGEPMPSLTENSLIGGHRRDQSHEPSAIERSVD